MVPGLVLAACTSAPTRSGPAPTSSAAPSPGVVVLREPVREEAQFQSTRHPELGTLSVRSFANSMGRDRSGARRTGHMVTIALASGDRFPPLAREADDARTLAVVSEFAAGRLCRETGIDRVFRATPGSAFGTETTIQQRNLKSAVVACR